MTTMNLGSTTEGEVLLSIADVVKMFKLTLRALRFYEEKGMIVPQRTGKGTASRRWYGPKEIERLKEITRLTAAGFSLREVREVIAVDDPDLKKQTMAKIATVVQERLSSDLKTLMSQTRALERLSQEFS